MGTEGVQSMTPLPAGEPPCWEVQLKPYGLDDQKPEDEPSPSYKSTRKALLPPGRGGGGLDRQKRAEDVSKDVVFVSHLRWRCVASIRGCPNRRIPVAPEVHRFPAAPEIGFRRGEATKEPIEDLIGQQHPAKTGPRPIPSHGSRLTVAERFLSPRGRRRRWMRCLAGERQKRTSTTRGSNTKLNLWKPLRPRVVLWPQERTAP